MRKAVLAVSSVAYAVFAAVVSVSSVSVSHAQSAPAKAESPKVQAGQDIFNQKCLQCHSYVEGQTSFGPNLYHEMKKTPGKKSATEIKLILKNGKNKMPSFDGKLTPEDTDNLLAFLHTL